MWLIQSNRIKNDCLSVEEAAVSRPLSIQDMIGGYPGTSRGTWAQARYTGTGPHFFKVGRRVFYRPEDVTAWEESSIRVRTDEHVA